MPGCQAGVFADREVAASVPGRALGTKQSSDLRDWGPAPPPSPPAHCVPESAWERERPWPPSTSPRRHRQGPRHLRRRREDRLLIVTRPHLRARRGSWTSPSPTRPGADRHLGVLVRRAGRRRPHHLFLHRPGRPARRGAGPEPGWAGPRLCARPRCCRSSASCGLPPPGLAWEGVPAVGGRCTARPARRPPEWAQLPEPVQFTLSTKAEGGPRRQHLAVGGAIDPAAPTSPAGPGHQARALPSGRGVLAAERGSSLPTPSSSFLS